MSWLVLIIGLPLSLLILLTACSSPSQEELVVWIDQCDYDSWYGDVDTSKSCHDLFDHFNKGFKEDREVCEAVRVAIRTDKVGTSMAQFLDCYVPPELFQYLLR